MLLSGGLCPHVIHSAFLCETSHDLKACRQEILSSSVKDVSPAMLLQEQVGGRLASALAARRARGPRDPVVEGPAVACIGVTLPHPRRSP